MIRYEGMKFTMLYIFDSFYESFFPISCKGYDVSYRTNAYVILVIMKLMSKNYPTKLTRSSMYPIKSENIEKPIISV